MKKFEDYIIKGNVRNVIPDISRVNSLIQEAKKRKGFIEIMKNNIALSDDTASYFFENAYIR